MWIFLSYSVMEYGKLRRIYIIIFISAINEILEHKTIEAYYWSYNYDKRQHCLQCDPANTLGDPIEIWDHFPCPPETDPDLFLDLNFLGRLGEDDGKAVRQRVAKRCSISLKVADSHEFVKSSLFIDNCDINCIFVVLAVFVCCVVLSIPAVLCCMKRKNVCKWVTKKTVSRHSSSRNPPFYGDNLYPPLNSSITRDSEIVYSPDGAHARLISPVVSNESSVTPYRYYEKIYNDKDPTDVENETNQMLHKNSSEETSLTYSGTDTTHTYESLKDSQKSASFRLSNTSGASVQIQNPIEQQYNSSLASSSGQKPCQCPRCSRTNIYRPYESIDYNVAYNVFPQKITYPYNRFHQYRIPSPSGGAVSDNENESFRYASKHPKTESIPGDTFYIEEPAPPEGMRKGASFYDSDPYEGSSNSDYPYRRNKCNCRKCSQTNLNYNPRLTSPTNPSESEFYGVPDQMTINMVPLRSCNCRRCSQNNLNQLAYDKQTSYFPQRQPCSCKKCLQALQRNNPNIEPYVFDPNMNQDMPPEDKETKSKTEKKRRKNKSDRPSSVHATSSDTNTGSEKSYRMGIPKTNGSLYRSKLSKT